MPLHLPRRSESRLPSAVRIRKHQSSRLGRFLELHRDSSQTPEEEGNGGDSHLERSGNSKGATLKRPRLGTLSSDGRRVSGRRKSAVERLALEDKQGRSVEDSAVGSRLAATQASRARSRATDGHVPQLENVSEDVSPMSNPVGATATSSQRREGLDSAKSPSFQEGEIRDYFLHPSPTEGGVEAGQKPPPSPRTLPAMAGSTASQSPGAAPVRFHKQSESPPSTSKGAKAANIEENGGTRDDRLHRTRSNVSIPTPVTEETQSQEDGYDDENHTDDVADYLDVVDPEVGALGYLSNIGNSIFVPHVPALYDRRPTHNLPTNRKRGLSFSSALDPRRGSVGSSRSRRSRGSDGAMEEGRAPSPATGFTGGARPALTGSRSMLSRVSSAVGWGRREEEDEFTQHIKKWREMDEEERDELDEHVRMLLTKKSKFKRGLKGFYAFVKTPMGFIMTLYGFLITFWGTAIVLFIFGWIHVGARKRYWIEICDQILCALFAAVGLGFAPFRAVDTYRMIHIAHYHHLSWKRRQTLGLSDLKDPNDLPRPEKDGSNQVHRADENEEDSRSELQQEESSGPVTSVVESKFSLLQPNSSSSSSKKRNGRDSSSSVGHKFHKKVMLPSHSQEEADAADATGRTGDLSKGRLGGKAPPLKRNESIQSELIKEKEDVVVLTKGEQQVLEHHQRKFHASHTFYRYHECATHRAFPLDLMIVIVCLLDCHSLLQAALGGCTWGIKYTHRPTALTAVLISCSLSCNAVAGLIIYLGGRRTKKREEVERRLKIALEQEALEKIERRRARGELPDREHGDRSSDEEEREAFDQGRDRLAKRLGHVESASSNASTTIEMSPVKRDPTKEGLVSSST